MPLRFSVDHPNRVIVAVGRGEVTLADLAQFAQDILRGHMVGHGKLIDVTGVTGCFSARELLAFAKLLRALGQDRSPALPVAPGPVATGPFGPIAVVTDPYNTLADDLGKQTQGSDSGVQAFQSIREARQWLDSHKPPHRWEPAQRLPEQE